MSETPRTAEQLVNELETCAFDCGDYSNSVTASQARIAKHEAALRKAEKDVIERITTLEAELAAVTAELELANRQVKLLCGHIDDYGSCWNCPAKVLGAACSHSGESCREQLAAWSRAEAEKGGKG